MIEKNNIAAKFQDHFLKISTESFLKKNSLGGEIPFWISTYSPEAELEVTKAIKSLKNKLENNGIPILEINLYDISMQILNEQLGENAIFEIEQQMDKIEFKSALKSVLDLNEVFMPRLKSIIDTSQAKVYFITGVGTCYPFIRSHNVLNNLQNIAKVAPTVMFFPGTYTGHALNLFSLFKDDNYYRAYHIDTFKI